MIQIVKSILGSCDIEYNNELQIILSDENKSILSPDELDVFKYLSKEFENNKQFPTPAIFLTKFPQYRQQLDEFQVLSIVDLRYYRKQFITKHQNIFKSRMLHKMASEAVVNGITPDMAEQIRKQTTFDDISDNEQSLSFRDRYTKSMKENSGLVTGIESIDDEIGSIAKGAVCTIAGYTGSFKCVSENERIYTNRGLLTIKEIYEIGINNGLQVQSEYGFRDLVAVHDEGEKESYIIYVNGIPLEMSPVHRLRVLTDDGELIWKEARTVEIGDKIVQSLKKSEHTSSLMDNNSINKFCGTIANYISHADFPEILFYLNYSIWERFIIELYASSAYVCDFSFRSSYSFLVSLSRLLSAMGISSSLSNDNDGSYLLEIVGMKSKINFINIIKSYDSSIDISMNLEHDEFANVKSLYLSEIANAELTWHPVTKIERSKCYMYDLTVDGSPTYLLNGFVTHNTTWAVNMAIRNALAGKNIAYISLEVSKEQLEYSIFSLFSNDSRFSRIGYNPIGHQKIRQNKLDTDEINFLCDVLEPEYRRVIEPNFHILDESRFKTFSESEILDALIQLDDEKPLDAVFFDHAGLFAFKSPLYNSGNVGLAINHYVSFIRQISICFRKKDGESRGLTSVLLAQTNRTGYKEATRSFRKLNSVNRPGDKANSKNNLTTQAEGYSLTALSDANELERCSSVVLFVYTNDDLKYGGQAYVQMAKTRYGSNVLPTLVDVNPEYYQFGGYGMVNEDELSADLIDGLSSCCNDFNNAGTDIRTDMDDIFGI